jgi:hypothetical protein
MLGIDSASPSPRAGSHISRSIVARSGAGRCQRMVERAIVSGTDIRLTAEAENW